MFIRRTQIKSRQNGEPYYTYRLVENERVEGKVKQRTLLNLGRYFSVPREQWANLIQCIEQLLSHQSALPLFDYSEALEKQAQHIVAKLLVRCSVSETVDATSSMATVNVDTLELVQPRRIDIEQLACHAMP